MENVKCAVEGCFGPAGFLAGPDFERLICWEHLQQFRSGNREGDFMKNYCRQIVSERDITYLEFAMGSSFGISGLFWVVSEVTCVPEDMAAALEGLTKVFINSIFDAGNGKLNVVKKLCNKFAAALQQIIFNLQFNIQELYTAIEKVYNFFHSEKQTIFSNLISTELESIENRLQLPKIATKNFITKLDIEAIKQNFIFKYFTQDSIDFKELFQTFCTNFSPFLSAKPNPSIFDNLESTLMLEFNKLKFNIQSELSSIIKKLWLDPIYQMTSVFMREIPKNNEILNIDYNKLRICSLILTQTLTILKSVHSISKSDLLIVLSVNNNSYLILFSNNRSYLIKEYIKTEVQIADGSDENMFLVLSQGKCEVFALIPSEIKLAYDINLRLEPNEEVEDLIFIQAARPRVIFSSNKPALCSVVKNGPRAFINLNADVSEFGWKLKFYKAKEVILLKSNRKIRIFSEFLVMIGEISVEWELFCFRPCQERALRVLGLKGKQVHERDLEVRLDYSEPWQSGVVSIPGPSSHYVSKLLSEEFLNGILPLFNQFVSRSFLIRS